MTGAIVDSLFVSLLVGATAVLLWGIRSVLAFLGRKGADFYQFVLGTASPEHAYFEHARLCATVSSTPRMTLSGLCYGALIGSAPFVMPVWPDEPYSRTTLALFMFGVNFVTGVAFYGLLTFFVFAVRMGAQAKVDLWQASNPSTDFLTGATRRIGIVASLYVSICLSSILFSVLPLDELVLAYACFAALTIVASVLAPSYPLARRLRQAKAMALRDLDDQVQAAFSEVLTHKSGGDEASLARLHALLNLRERIERIRSWPFRLESLSAAVSVVLVSAIPVVLQIVLERLAD